LRRPPTPSASAGVHWCLHTHQIGWARVPLSGFNSRQLCHFKFLRCAMSHSPSSCQGLHSKYFPGFLLYGTSQILKVLFTKFSCHTGPHCRSHKPIKPAGTYTACSNISVGKFFGQSSCSCPDDPPHSA